MEKKKLVSEGQKRDQFSGTSRHLK